MDDNKPIDESMKNPFKSIREQSRIATMQLALKNPLNENQKQMVKNLALRQSKKQD